MSFASTLIRSGSLPIYFVTFTHTNGRDCWFYITSTAEKMRQFNALTDGTFDLNDYGKIIAGDYGKGPSPEQQSELEALYNIPPSSSQ